MKRGWLVGVVVGLGLAAPLWAGAGARLEAATRGLKGLQGEFVQRVYDGDGKLSEESRGTVALAAPRQFRWEYRQPFPQQIVADGDHVWIYDPDLEQVTVRKQSLEEQGSPLAALIDPDELRRQFDLAEGGERDGLDWLVLTPRQAEGSQFEKVWLGLDEAGLRRMRMQDTQGQRTEIEFAGWQRNPQFPAGTFRFVPPPGVDVVGEVAEGAEVYPLDR